MNTDTIDPKIEIQQIHDLLSEKLVQNGVSADNIGKRGLLLPSVIYLVYWHHRLRNNKAEQSRIATDLSEYIGNSVSDRQYITQVLVSDEEVIVTAQKYVESYLVPTRTIDLVIMPSSQEKKVLCLQRGYYPFGIALPGGFIRDTDETNQLGIAPELFAALRVAAEKVLKLSAKQAIYKEESNPDGTTSYLVHGPSGKTTVKIFPVDQGGYRYSESPRSIYRPSDPRHIVNTVAYRCEVDGPVDDDFIWRDKDDIMSPESYLGGFAFGHHREIVAHILSRTDISKQRDLEERTFIRSIINNPVEMYNHFKSRIEESDNPEVMSLPELFPAVDRLLREMFTDEINRMCEQNPLIAGIRDDAVIALRQVSLANRVFCPYRPTVGAIYQAIQFFDHIARLKRGFYDAVPKDRIIEHNPRQIKNALYHSYRYTYRYNELMTLTPWIMVIPTFEPLSATDLLKVRGVPILFLGLSTDFLYVDEFEQSPKEFYMHDANHSWRMVQEDLKYMKRMDVTRDELVEQSNNFMNEFLLSIKIIKSDAGQVRELKKLKKIILFEIVHEDARPFIRDVIGEYIQQVEGGSVPFEVPRIDPVSWYMDIVDTLDLGISTLSYVRNKLQHGFYDEVDAQLPQIVSPEYRTARWIAEAAYEMLVELGIPPSIEAELDEHGFVSHDWLLRRTCAVGPDNVHTTSFVDPDEGTFGDGASVNLKRYQVEA